VYFYIVANVLVGIFVLGVLRILGLEVTTNGEVRQRAIQAGTAGITGLALVRTSLLGRRLDVPPSTVGSDANPVGQSPQALLVYVLRQADLQVRERFNNWLTGAAGPLSTGWGFGTNGTEVATLCQQLAELDDGERGAMSDAVKEIAEQNLPDAAKTFMLARVCIRYTSRECLHTALGKLGVDLPKPG
jgi:hypothetical protein